MPRKPRPEKLEAEWIGAFAKEIPISEDRFAPLIGIQLAQAVLYPYRGQAFAWDLRDLKGIIRCFRSEINHGTLSNYTPIDFHSDRALRFLKGFEGRTLPLLPHDSKYWGLDGETRELHLFYGFARVSFRWWSLFPDEWNPVISAAEKLIQELESAPILPLKIVVESVLSQP
ncbi:MAG: hypothetical protein JNM27_21355 [Leptospirales bacterium]|nr:hypothetical protein [Leptospirales bacterium]